MPVASTSLIARYFCCGRKSAANSDSTGDGFSIRETQLYSQLGEDNLMQVASSSHITKEVTPAGLQ